MKEKALEKLTKELEAIRNSIPEENPMAEMLKQQSTILIREIMKRCLKSNSLCEDVLQEHKSWDRCIKYVTKNAQEMAFSCAGGKMACIPDETVYEWAEDYFHLDDKAEVEAEMEAERKQREEREKKRKLEEEKMAIAKQKAIEKLSAEENWDELSEKEKEQKIMSEARKIKLTLDRKKTTKKKEKKEKKETAKEVVEDKTKESAKEEKVETVETIETENIPEVSFPDPEDDGTQMDIFSMM